MPLVHGVMLLKTIEASFHARLGWAADTAVHAARQLCAALKKLILPVKHNKRIRYGAPACCMSPSCRPIGIPWTSTRC